MENSLWNAVENNKLLMNLKYILLRVVLNWFIQTKPQPDKRAGVLLSFQFLNFMQLTL
jgi:hypothetical protein